MEERTRHSAIANAPALVTRSRALARLSTVSQKSTITNSRIARSLTRPPSCRRYRCADIPRIACRYRVSGIEVPRRYSSPYQSQSPPALSRRKPTVIHHHHVDCGLQRFSTAADTERPAHAHIPGLYTMQASQSAMRYVRGCREPYRRAIADVYFFCL